MNWRNEFKSREDALITAANQKNREADELEAHAKFLRGEVIVINVELEAIRRALSEPAGQAETQRIGTSETMDDAIARLRTGGTTRLVSGGTEQ